MSDDKNNLQEKKKMLLPPDIFFGSTQKLKKLGGQKKKKKKQLGASYPPAEYYIALNSTLLHCITVFLWQILLSMHECELHLRCWPHLTLL